MSSDKLTKQIISKMLKENTGRSILDSGDFYGRHYERNQLREFDKESPVNLSFRLKSIDYTLNIYHFLCNALEYNKGLTNSFYTFERKYDTINPYAYWPEIIREWVKHKGYNEIMSDYTYNYNNFLSQDIQFWLVSTELTHSDIYDSEFCILQIHNGCDARGGFTAPKIFNVDIDNLFNYSQGYIFCENHHSWYTNDAYNWYSDNRNDDTKLNDYKWLDLEEYQDTEEYQELVSKQIIIPDNQIPMFADYHPTVINPIKPPSGYLFIQDDNGYCPLCSKLLMA